MKTPAHIKIAAATLLLAVAALAQAPQPPEKRSWKSGATTATLSHDGTLTVSGKGRMGDYGERPPWHNSAITNLVIEEGVTSIGYGAFAGCTSLTSVTISNSVTSIENWAFAHTGLRSVTIPGGLKTIRDAAFLYCAGLTSVTIPRSVTSIEEHAFGYCAGLTSITVAADNTGYSSVDGVLFNKNKTVLIQYPPGRQGAYAIPGNVTEIGDGAFSRCTGLTSVTIPNSVTVIDYYAFDGCTDLTSVRIPGSVTRIGIGAFGNCTGLASITAAASSADFSSADGVLFSKNKTTLILYPQGRQGAFTIPSDVTSIERDAFYDCAGLTSIKVAADNARYSSRDGVLFDKNKTTLIRYPQGKLGAYTIPNSVATIEWGAFWGCAGLTSITIPASVTSIGGGAFKKCTGLTSVTIPGSVREIRVAAFEYCTGLTSIIARNPNPPQTDLHTFGGGDLRDVCLYVPAGSIKAYRAAKMWERFECIKPLESVPKGE